MIGNDIIDRSVIGERSQAHWAAVRAKTMTEAEQALLIEYRKEQLDIWLAWAIKESIYKLEYQLQPKRYFAPRAIQVLSLARARGKLGAYPIDLEWNTDYIHAVAWLSPKVIPQKKIFHKHKSKLNDLILADLSERFPARDFRIEQQLFPQVKVDGHAVWPLSKSHHGRWVAFAYATP